MQTRSEAIKSLERKLDSEYGFGGMNVSQIAKAFHISKSSIPVKRFDVMSPEDKKYKKYSNYSIACWYCGGFKQGF
jgi:hypothetical protein